MNKIGQLFIIAAPSGAGKTSITMAVIEKLKNTVLPIEKVITCTTRPIRPGEVDGVDYHFFSQEEFLRKKNMGFFIETTKYNENYYGSPASIFTEMKNGKSFILVADMAGAKNFKSNIKPDAVSIWISVPDAQELRRRLEKRGDSKEGIEKRVTLAQEEMAQEAREKMFDYHVLNNNFDTAVHDVIEIIKQKTAK